MFKAFNHKCDFIILCYSVNKNVTLSLIFFFIPMAGFFCQSIKKMARAYFWRKLPCINCFQFYQMVEENRSVGNTKIGNSDTPQMIHAGIPHRQRDLPEITI